MDCSVCGKSTNEKDGTCLKCKADKETGQSEDSIMAAIIAAFIFPGLGQAYNREFGKAAIIFIGFIIGLLLFIIPGIIIWLYGLYDAYKIAKEKLNKRWM